MRYAKEQQRSGVVDANLLNDLPAEHNSGFDGELIWRSFKLQLRQIHQVTDDEMRELAKLHYAYREPVEVNTEKYKRCASWYDEDKSLVELKIYDAGELVVEADFPVSDRIPYAAYLQSIGVYVPGSIDEAYVELLSD